MFRVVGTEPDGRRRQQGMGATSVSEVTTSRNGLGCSPTIRKECFLRSGYCGAAVSRYQAFQSVSRNL